MKTLHNFTLRIQTGGAGRVLKPNGTCLTRFKQINLTWGKCHNQWKVVLEKNWFEVSQNSILYACYYKICSFFELRNY